MCFCATFISAIMTMAEWQRSALGIFKRDGIFAEYATVPLVNLHIVPESLSDDQVRRVLAPPFSSSACGQVW